LGVTDSDDAASWRRRFKPARPSTGAYSGKQICKQELQQEMACKVNMLVSFIFFVNPQLRNAAIFHNPRM
ncbi:MAG TPA: hypothetical protein VKE94_20120, partial [Gemmataceae bacterium]|nr:hypothetical protein [Gemmataceae bacterium]